MMPPTLNKSYPRVTSMSPIEKTGLSYHGPDATD